MQNQSCFGGRLIVVPLVHLLLIPSTPMQLKLINNPLCYLTDQIIIREVQLKSCHTLIKKCSFNFFEQCNYHSSDKDELAMTRVDILLLISWWAAGAVVSCPLLCLCRVIRGRWHTLPEGRETRDGGEKLGGTEVSVQIWILFWLSEQICDVLKMAPRTAASVCWCALFCLVLLVNSVFCLKTGSSFTREMLMNIRVITPDNLFPTFIASSAEIFSVVHTVKRRRRGKRAGSLVRLRQWGLRSPLPGIFLSNVRSLCNKLDELQLLVGKNRDFSSSSVLCFTETWLSDSIPDSALQLAGFQLFRVDRHTEL